MSIPIISSTNVSTSTATAAGQAGASIRNTAGQDFQALLQSLQQSNLSGAQQAYANIQQLFSANGASSNTASATSTTSGSSGNVVNDWNALGQALQSGSISSAQSTLATLQQDALAAVQSKFGSNATQQSAASVYAALQVPGTSTSSASNASGGNLQNDISSLNQALQSGDTASAQQLLAQLNSDLQQALSNNTSGHHHHHKHSQTSQATQANNTTGTNAYTDLASAATTSTASTSAASSAVSSIAALI